MKKAARRLRHAASSLRRSKPTDQARLTFAVSVFGLSPVIEAFT